MKDSITPLIRMVIQLLCGYLAKHGFDTKDGDAEIVTAGVIAIGTVIWSHWEKKSIRATAKVEAEIAIIKP